MIFGKMCMSISSFPHELLEYVLGYRPNLCNCGCFCKVYICRQLYHPQTRDKSNSKIIFPHELPKYVQWCWLYKGPSINDVGNWEGEGVKNWSKLPTNSTNKKLPTWEAWCQKFKKIADVVYGWSLKVRDFQEKIGIIYRLKQICRFTIINSSFEFSRIFCQYAGLWLAVIHHNQM